MFPAVRGCCQRADRQAGVIMLLTVHPAPDISIFPHSYHRFNSYHIKYVTPGCRHELTTLYSS